MLLEVGKAVSFLASLLSMLPLLEHAFFVPGTRWEERLVLALQQLVLSGCVCFMSGLVLTWPSATNPEAKVSVFRTLPVRMYLWAAFGMTFLFGWSWYLAVFYVPLLWEESVLVSPRLRGQAS